MTETFDPGTEAERWNHHPGEVRLNPLFEWPPRPIAVFNWYRGAWFQVTAVTVPFLLALAMWWALIPPLERMQHFAFGWMLQVWLANLIPQILVAGGLQWWLYGRKGQGLAKKFDKRDLAYKNGIFTFNNQLWDNVFWTLGSAITVATIYQWGIFWAMANGYVPTVTFSENPVWFLFWLALIPMWSSFHYYWTHRLEHHPKIYPWVHALHHRNVNIGPWTGISNHWFENILYFSTYWIHLLVASHPIHVMFHAMFQQVSPVMSHSGFEKILAGDNEAARAGDFFHQLHHRYFECNYGTSEMPFDKWFGTFHNGSEAATTRTRAYKKKWFG